MKKIDLKKAMNPVNMAMITNEENKNFYDVNRLYLYEGVIQDKILKTTIKCKIEGGKEEKDEALNKFIEFMEQLNMAFNRAVGAPESMKLFKVLDKQARYAGNDTIVVELTMATLATGTGSAIYALSNYASMAVNVWETRYRFIETKNVMLAKETYGLGNALRSWKSVMKKYGIPNNFETCVSLMPWYRTEV